MITLFLIVISAALTSLSLIFHPLALFAFVSISPFFYVLYNAANKKIKLRRAYLYGLLWSFVYYIINYHWFTYLYPMEFMDITPLEALGLIALCWLGLSLFQTLEMAFIALAYRGTAYHRFLSPVLFASIWTVFEYLQTLTWTGVPWARLSLSQVGFLPALQSASLFGSLFVSFIIVLVNGYLALAFIEFKNSGIKAKKTVIYALVALSVFSLNIIFGLFCMGLHRENKERAVKVALIQGNISSNDKWQMSARDSLELYVKMTYEASEKEKSQTDGDAAGGIDFVVWPETVINYHMMNDEEAVDSVKALAKDTGAVILVGTFDSDESNEYNAIIAFFPDGSVDSNPYYKQHLVPFGEYLPMKGFIKTFLPMLASMNMFEDEITPGTDSAVIETEKGAVGRLICFDSIYQSLARKSVKDGAEIIMLSTNDSWYTNSAAVYQHNSHAVLRAIENRRWIVRAANTGISSVITSSGETVEYLPPLVDGYMVQTAYMTSSRSLYSYVGDIFVLFAAGFIILEGAFVLREKIKNRHK